MDFDFSDDLREARTLADDVFGELAPVERVRHVERELEGFDATLWAALAETGLLALALPEEDGGAGLGMLSLVAVLERQGRFVAPVPLGPSLATAVLPVSRFGSDELRERWMPGVVSGTTILTGGVDSSTGGDRALTATPSADGWVVSGVLEAVPAGLQAGAVLTPVSTPGDILTALIPTDRPGVQREAVEVTSRTAHARITFHDVDLAASDLVGDGAEATVYARLLGRIAGAAVQAGVCHEAVARAAAHTTQREQFGRPLSTNQAVAQRAADAYLDADRITVTARRAAWLADNDDPAAASAALVAAWWASKAGLRAVHAAQHLHGGLGADIEYPIHRYFLWGRQQAFTLGSAASLSAELGAQLDTLPKIGAPS